MVPTMKFPRDHILSEIRRVAADAGGTAPGSKRFASETGIKEHDWRGVYWARWGDALAEAGFPPNEWQSAYDKDHVLAKYAELATELKRLPTSSDIELKRRSDTTFPGVKSLRRLGTPAERLRALVDFCKQGSRYEQVVSLCEARLASLSDRAHKVSSSPSVLGYVYLLKHGSRREYKIGMTMNPLRRSGEIAIELPERVEPVHVIETDDPIGIEAYWHRRFAAKRKNGEWFGLTNDDVRAFRRRRFM